MVTEWRYINKLASPCLLLTRAQNANFQNSRCENTPLIGRESPPPSVSVAFPVQNTSAIGTPLAHSAFAFCVGTGR